MSGNTALLKFAGDDKDLSKTIERVIAQSDSAASHIENSGKSLITWANRLGAAGSAVSGLTSAMGGIATASGALLALPAAGVAAASVMAAVQLGAEGAARAFERMTPALDRLKSAVSSSFEQALNPAMDTLAGLLPRLQSPLQGIVSQIGGMAVEASRTAALPANMSVLQTVLGGTNSALGSMRAAIAPLTQAFFDLVSVAAPGIGGIGAGVAGLATSFAEWVSAAKESGKLKEWLDSGIAALKAMWATLVDIAGIVKGVFVGISQGAGGATGALGPLLDTINRIVNSEAGQEVLQAIGAALRTIGEAVTSVALPAFEALAPVIPPLLDLFGQMLTLLADSLVPVIEFFAPGLEAVAGFIQDNVNWLGPLAASLAVAAATWWLLNAAMNANPLVLVATLVGALVLAIVSLWERSAAFRDMFIAVWHGIQNVVGAVVGWITQTWDALVGWFGQIPGRIGGAFRSIGDVIGNAFKSAINIVINILNWFVDRANDIIGGINAVSPFADIPNIGRIPRLHTGGLVPGAPGTETLTMLQAGERVTAANADTGGRAGVAQMTSSGGLADLINYALRTGELELVVDGTKVVAA